MIAPIGRTRTAPTSRARRTISSVTARWSLTGRVFGMQQIGGEPARGRRARAGLDVFLVFLAGLAQVDVEVDQTRARSTGP